MSDLGAAAAGDNQRATAAQVGSPRRLAVDESDNLYIASKSVQNSVAGENSMKHLRPCVAGLPCHAMTTNCTRRCTGQVPHPPTELATGCLHPAVDQGRVRKVDRAGIITTIAGGGLSEFFVPRPVQPA